MYRPSRLNLTSEMEEMISEKKNRFVGSSSSSYTMVRSLNLAPEQSPIERVGRTFRMPVAQSRVSHIRQLDVAFRTGIHEYVALCRMEFSGRDNLCEFLHVSWFDVHNVYTSKC